jgi:hypothetical protein
VIAVAEVGLVSTVWKSFDWPAAPELATPYASRSYGLVRSSSSGALAFVRSAHKADSRARHEPVDYARCRAYRQDSWCVHGGGAA